MKKFYSWILGAVILAGCTLSGIPEEVQVQTRVAQILTTFPTPSVLAEVPTNTKPVQTKEQATATLEQAAPSPTSESTTAATQESATSTSQATATPTQNMTVSPTGQFSAEDIRSGLGNPTFFDPMDTTNYWPTDPNAFTEVGFKNGVMSLEALSSSYGWRIASSQPIADFYLEITGSFESCSGADSYGLIFRVPVLEEADRGYLLGITCDGNYFLKIWDGKTAPKGEMTTLIAHKYNSNIAQGAGQPNRLGVRFVGSNIKIYVNGIFIHEISDTTWAQGYFGVFINQEATNGLVVNIDEIAFWTLK